jgi:16S rRNA (adenine1518-N6/adenine1519-N6)-dimethyltransferase
VGLTIFGYRTIIGKSMNAPKKSLGQHWLSDKATLNYIVDSADITPDDTVLEIGPGTGTLTAKLLDCGVKVIAVEKDKKLAADLAKHENLRVVPGDILAFDTGQLPVGYKVVANIPYYLTSNLLRVLSESANPPAAMVLLVQKEVAERIAAGPGQMSLLAISVQLYYEPTLGAVVPARLFTPVPKVDSQVVILKRHKKPLFKDLDSQKFFQLAKAGFSERRKKLRSSLSGGLGISKDQADDLLKKASVSPDARAQELSLEDWYKIYQLLPCSCQNYLTC